MKKSLLLLTSICSLCLLHGCGGGGSGGNLPPPVVVVATHFSVTAPTSPQTAGTAFSITVTALNASNGLVSGYAGTVHFSSSDAQAVLPTNSTLTNGTGTFSATLKTGPSETITATDTVESSITGTSTSINVSTPAPTVTISASSNTITLGQPVTLSWSSTNATSCRASANPSESDWSGSELMSGSQSVTPESAGMVIYTLVCTGAGGSAPGSAFVAANTNSNFAITSGPPPPGTIGRQYGQSHGRLHITFFQLTASGGTGSSSWSWAAAPGSSLPPGLACCTFFFGSPPGPISRFDGAINGVPTATGTYHVVVTVTDSGSPPALASADFKIVINYPPPPSINTLPPPAIGTLNSPYVGFTFTATDGFPPFSWSETGALPKGLDLSRGGTLSGKPTEAGSFNIAVMVQDSLGRNAVPQDFKILVLSTGFTPTGSMGTTRSSHTATLLNNGKVLVTGGGSATAELFDPTSGSFSPASSMGTARSSHTATLLSDGKVLVTGGAASGVALATAEIFDPASGSFAPTGSMGIARSSHTATLLNDGKVLVTGGVDATGGSVATAELFDPISGSFAPTGSMGTVRSSHTATLLNDGKVLVTGGVDVATAELFDPVSGSFAPTGSMGTARYSHAATLLSDGKVLVTGGSTGGAVLATAEIFDPASGTFASTANMGSVRCLHTARLLKDGKVLVTGGLENFSRMPALSAAELFDPTSGTFGATADTTAARYSHTATLLTNGKVLVTGGLGSAVAGFSTALATAELYQ